MIHSLIRQSEIAFYGFFHNSTIQNQRLDMMASKTVKRQRQGGKEGGVFYGLFARAN